MLPNSHPWKQVKVQCTGVYLQSQHRWGGWRTALQFVNQQEQQKQNSASTTLEPFVLWPLPACCGACVPQSVQSICCLLFVCLFVFKTGFFCAFLAVLELTLCKPGLASSSPTSASQVLTTARPREHFLEVSRGPNLLGGIIVHGCLGLWPVSQPVLSSPDPCWFPTS